MNVVYLLSHTCTALRFFYEVRITFVECLYSTAVCFLQWSSHYFDLTFASAYECCSFVVADLYGTVVRFFVPSSSHYLCRLLVRHRGLFSSMKFALLWLHICIRISMLSICCRILIRHYRLFVFFSSSSHYLCRMLARHRGLFSSMKFAFFILFSGSPPLRICVGFLSTWPSYLMRMWVRACARESLLLVWEGEMFFLSGIRWLFAHN